MNALAQWTEQISFSQLIGGEFLTQVLRYFVLAGAAYAFVWFGPRFRKRKLDPRALPPGQLRFEMINSFGTIVVFTVSGAITIYLHRKFGVFRFYTDAYRYGTAYLILSPLLLLFLHDTYFYWTHRLMHHRRLFRLIHREHHRSVSPTPFTIYSFHPLEAAIEAVSVPLIATFLPLHAVTILFFLMATITMNLIGHLGYELYGRTFWRSFFAEFITTATYHQEHHQGGPNSNFGFYFRFWDRLCGTEDRRYATELNSRRERAPVPAPIPVRAPASDRDRPSHSS